MSEAFMEAARAAAAQSRAEQGLPPTLEDSATITRITAMLTDSSARPPA